MTMRLATAAATLMTGLIATSAAAQDACGGSGTGGIWIGGDEGASDIAAIAAPAEQLALVLGVSSYVSLFTVTAPTDVRIEAVGNGAGDPLLDLLSPTGDVFISDDDGGGGTSSRIEATLDPGTYCAVLTSFDNSPMTGTIRIGRTEHDAITENFTGNGTVLSDPLQGAGCGSGNTIADAPLDAILSGGGASVTAPAAEISGYDFTTTAPVTLSITAENETADPVLTLSDASGAVLYENDDYDGLNSRIDVSDPLEPGDYCIGVRALGEMAEPITITVTDYDAEAAARVAFDQGEAIPPLDGSYPIMDLGTIDTLLRTDVTMTPGVASWFSLDMPEAGLLMIEAVSGSEGDPVLILYDIVGREIAYNDDSGPGLDPTIAARLFAGPHLVALTDLNDSGDSVRIVIERFVPAR